MPLANASRLNVEFVKRPCDNRKGPPALMSKITRGKFLSVTEGTLSDSLERVHIALVGTHRCHSPNDDQLPSPRNDCR